MDNYDLIGLLGHYDLRTKKVELEHMDNCFSFT